MEFQHEPVLLNEVISRMDLQPAGVYVDCTLGGAGHSLAMLQAQPSIHLIGIDQDPQALEVAKQRLAGYAAQVTLIHSNYRYIAQVLRNLSIEQVDGVLMDIGVSSPQLDQAERGFSYQHDAPLDMRMNPDATLTAQVLVNTLSETELAKIIWDYGEERWAKRIANFIVAKRQSGSIERTGDLVEIIKAAIPAQARRGGPHPAKRTFQALRIQVNEELDVLTEGLSQAVTVLRPTGRLCVITFHSLEDRIVKATFRELAKGCICPPDFPICVCGKQPLVKLITGKPEVAQEAELVRNPRARSAKLRVCERLLLKEG